MAYPGPPRRTGLLRYGIFAVAIIGLLYFFRLNAQFASLASAHENINLTPGDLPYVPTPQNPTIPIPTPGHTPEKMGSIEHESSKDANSVQTVAQKPVPEPVPTKAAHPIDELIEKAEKSFEEVLQKESHDLKTTAAEYRKRRGRHPPPGFDVWYDFAKQNNVVMVEDFFDQIYHDLSPFWGLSPAIMRKEAWEYDMTINIRNQRAKTKSEWFWTKMWLNMTQTIEDMLPDMDIPLNAMDEPRIVAPWEEINRLVGIEKASRSLPPPNEVISNYQTLPKEPEKSLISRPKNFSDKAPFWKAAIRGCHPDSLARKADMLSHYNQTPTISLTHAMKHTYKGYVSNFTLSTDFCHQPDLQSLHGMMIEPLSTSETKTFAPLFGGSKLPTNNEILLPAAMYWADEERFSGGGATGAPWTDKLDQVVWRGVATGGRNRVDNWKGFQRHRFVAMTNGTKVSRAEAWTEVPENWAMPTSQYNLAAQQEGRLGEWTKEWADTGFVDLMCEPSGENLTCPYTDPYFKVIEGMTMGDQFDRKFLPDIDGNSYSGRYRGFLRSSSLPIKATIFREWHDSRLMPWVHFVPMDNRFLDFWGIMEYFVGYKGKHVDVPGHDEQAEKIAMVGQKWADKVLRKQDMQIYVHRLLLEYARLSDDRREKMGYVQDLLDK